MRPPTLQHRSAELVQALADLLDCAPTRIRLREPESGPRWDYLITAPGCSFQVEYKSTASAGPIAAALMQVRRYAELSSDRGLPLLVVPYMGPVGQEMCANSRVSWLDLSGNAKIDAPGLKIRIEGRPNKYRDRGRPPNVFASKSSRVARQLLLQPRQYLTQAELSRSTGLDDGYISKIVRRLEQEQLVEAHPAGGVRARDPNLLLDGWRAAYDFSRHRVLKGHVPARSGDELLRSMARRFARDQLDYAATGLAAASLFTKLASFRLATFYLAATPSRALLNAIEFTDGSPDANLWLVLPEDDGVFQGRRQLAGIHCVSALQTYVDLKSQPERADAVADELRKKLLKPRPLKK